MKKLLTFATALLLSVSGASAESRCGDPTAVIKELGDKYGETLQSFGLTSGPLMQLWANEETGTWSITFLMPDGRMCLMADGENYVEPEPPKEGDPA